MKRLCWLTLEARPGLCPGPAKGREALGTHYLRCGVQGRALALLPSPIALVKPANTPQIAKPPERMHAASGGRVAKLCYFAPGAKPEHLLGRVDQLPLPSRAATRFNSGGVMLMRHPPFPLTTRLLWDGGHRAVKKIAGRIFRRALLLRAYPASPASQARTPAASPKFSCTRRPMPPSCRAASHAVLVGHVVTDIDGHPAGKGRRAPSAAAPPAPCRRRAA